ncbi:hypothetical protein [Domibacillus robiginosus]|uniref:hypothetical protein n=1 Tax=Domibacillus robiginosus TaxID=1071054 RepID=UPI00067B6730|nr:hypothetical protein [Domibacillus robiginosus]
MTAWIQTDTFQYVLCNQDSNMFYRVVDLVYTGTAFKVKVVDINLYDYTETQLEKEIGGFYNLLSDVKRIYRDSWRQIVAEIIAENEAVDSDLTFKNAIDAAYYMKGIYDIPINEADYLAYDSGVDIEEMETSEAG